MEGLVEENKEAMDEIEDTEVLDAALLSDAQAVEHYEISRYGTLIAWANQLGMTDAVNLLEQTLAEEKKTDELLSKLAPRQREPQGRLIIGLACERARFGGPFLIASTRRRQGLGVLLDPGA